MQDSGQLFLKIYIFKMVRQKFRNIPNIHKIDDACSAGDMMGLYWLTGMTGQLKGKSERGWGWGGLHKDMPWVPL